MLTLRAEDILRLRSPGGDRFAEFVSNLIRAHARARCIADTAVRTNLNTVVPDGGVDAEVTAGTSGDPTRRMALPTGWQFKATAADQVGPAVLRVEIAKPYARRLVAAGASFAFCICAELTPERKADWHAVLSEAARAINPDAAPTQLLDADDLAAWANDYPALALAYRPLLAERVLTLQRWGESATGNTPRYVSSPSLDAAGRAIRRHVAFDEQPIDVVLTVRGPVGVGKTRLVYEALKGISGGDGLVLYTLDEHGLGLAYEAANADAFAIIVVDECTVRTSDRLRQLLDGHRSHIRVIAIESTVGDYRRGSGDAIWIEEVDDTTVDQILAANFPQVPPGRRRAYSRHTQGFLRFAVDLCRRDTETQIIELLPPAAFVEAYLRGRLTEEEQEVVAALALVDGIGYKAEAATELDRLADVVGLEPRRIMGVVRRIQEAPGIAARAGRYLHIRPPIVAQVAFSDAWARWGAADPMGFLSRIAEAPVLLKRFVRRVADSGSLEVRARVGALFSAWAEGLAPVNLTRPADVDALVTLVEVDPPKYVPSLRRLVEGAPQEQLLADIAAGPERRNVRRELVRIAERIAALPECFHDAEGILLRLALAESDPNLSNNATGTYKQLFQPILSGTRVPFDARLDVLAERLRSDDEPTALVAIAALGDAFNRTFSRGFDNPFVAGRIAGDDWEPSTAAEYYAGLARAFAMLQEAVGDQRAAVRVAAWDVAIRKLDLLVQYGFASALRTLFPPEAMPLDLRSRVLAQVSWLIALPGPRAGDGSDWRIPAAEHLQNLVEALRPADLHGRIVAAVGAERWQLVAFDREETWRRELDALAQELLAEPNVLEAELDWLCSDAARAAYDLGVSVGARDSRGDALASVVAAALRSREASFPMGYVAGLVSRPDQPNGPLNEVLDRLERDDPGVALGLAVSGGDGTRALERALRLLDRGAVSTAELWRFRFWVGGRALTDKEFFDVLKRLVVAGERGDAEAAAVALDLAHRRVAREQHGPKSRRVVRLARIRALLWRLLDATVEDPQGQEYGWGELLGALIPYDGERASRLAVLALGSTVYWHRDAASALVLGLVPAHPETIMRELGGLLIKERAESAHCSRSRRDIVGALPTTVVQAWVREQGPVGAAAVAYHLPRPTRDRDGRPVVANTTAWLLTEFTYDAVVEAFCDGSLVWSAEDEQDEEGRFVTMDLIVHQKLADIALSFLDHPLKPIREWARWIRQVAESTSMLHARLDEDASEQLFR
jgi:hypothetical protein